MKNLCIAVAVLVAALLLAPVPEAESTQALPLATSESDQGVFDVYSYNIHGLPIPGGNSKALRRDIGLRLQERIWDLGVPAIVGLQEDWRNVQTCDHPEWTRGMIWMPYQSLPSDTRETAGGMGVAFDTPCDLPWNDGLNIFSDLQFTDAYATPSPDWYGGHRAYEIHRETFDVLDDVPDNILRDSLWALIEVLWDWAGHNPVRWFLVGVLAAALANLGLTILTGALLLDWMQTLFDEAEVTPWTCLACKGFSLVRVEVHPGFEIDVYNVHTGPYNLRPAQFEQLMDFIEGHSGRLVDPARRAVIVMGDTNLKWIEENWADEPGDPSYPDDVEIFTELKTRLGLRSACQEAGPDAPYDELSVEPGGCVRQPQDPTIWTDPETWPEWQNTNSGALDQILYRGNAEYSLNLATFYDLDPDTPWESHYAQLDWGKDGGSCDDETCLSDHQPAWARLSWKKGQAPSNITLALDKTRVYEGEVVGLDITFEDDEGPHTVDIAWGDDDVGGLVDRFELPAGVWSLSAEHVYADDYLPKLEILVTVKDTDFPDQFMTATTWVTLDNAAPVVDAGPDQQADKEDLITIEATFNDPSTEDAHVASVDWGDGGPPVPVVAPSTDGVGSVVAEHSYAMPGRYTVTVEVTDDDYATGSDSLTVTLVDEAAPHCYGRPVTIYGTAGDDTLRGTSGPDVIHGMGGNDKLIGLGGDDALCGGDGDDILWSNGGFDVLLGEAGDDVLYGGGGDDSLYGGAGADTLIGGGGADVMWGQDGDDLLKGGAADDRLTGGRGDDELHGHGGDDTLKGSAGYDTGNGGAGTNTCTSIEAAVKCG